ncbi:MAG: hypothetical protein IJ555_09355 [Ruminococcus sp.]|nr:hypothetical protein [Ruminococcus sp.]
MIEITVLDYLTNSLSVPVYMEEPENPPDEYVLLEKTGSSENDHIQSAVLIVQSYAGSLYGAASLNGLVKRAMRDSITLDDVTRCKLNSDYNFTDTETKRYRYQAIFDITYYDN